MSSNRALLQERMGSIPGSMQMSPEASRRLWDSFVNIFKAGASSLKLVGQNILFNARMAVAAMDGDRAKMQQAFDQYAAARAQFAKEADQNLKYYREAFYDEVTDEYGRVTGQKLAMGPALLVGIANPLLVPALAWQPGKGFDGEIDDPTRIASREKGTTSATTVAASDRLTRALNYFGFGQKLSEAAAQQPSTQSPGNVSERNKLLQIARSFVDNEKRQGNEILESLMKRIQFFKKIVEASTFEEFQAALATAPSLGIKPITTGMSSSRDKIEREAKEKKEKDPEAFAQFVNGARASYPDLDPKDDIKAILEFTFRSSKSQIQQELMSSYATLMDSAMRTMNLPLTPDLEAKLAMTSIGKEYLDFLRKFQTQLETGKREIESAKKV